MSGINPLSSIVIPGSTVAPGVGGSQQIGSDDNPLGNVFSNILNEIVKLDGEAASLEEAMYSGAPVDLHKVVVAGEKAGIAFELLMEARNRLVEAYQELMRMPV